MKPVAKPARKFGHAMHISMCLWSLKGINDSNSHSMTKLSGWPRYSMKRKNIKSLTKLNLPCAEKDMMINFGYLQHRLAKSYLQTLYKLYYNISRFLTYIAL